MHPDWNMIIWQQFGAAIDMLDRAIDACSDDAWHAPLWQDTDFPGSSACWYVAYHTLFWLDLYLSGNVVDGFAPPEPFTLDELDPAGVLPPRPYTQAELRAYVAHCKAKCRATLADLSDEQATRPCTISLGTLSYAELLVYNMRHVQEHAAQIAMLLGQRSGIDLGWRARAS